MPPIPAVSRKRTDDRARQFENEAGFAYINGWTMLSGTPSFSITQFVIDRKAFGYFQTTGGESHL